MALGEISGFQQRLLNLELSRDIALPFWVSGSSSLLGTMKHFLRLVEISIKKKKTKQGGGQASRNGSCNSPFLPLFWKE